MNNEKIKKLAKEIKIKPGLIDHDRIIADAADALERSASARALAARLSIWRTIMTSRITKFAAAAVIITAVAVSLMLWNKTIPTATASVIEVLNDAAKAVEDVWSIHIKSRMRTLPADNFAHLDINDDFVPIELWKKTDDSGAVLWRIEKPGRVIATNAEATIMFIKTADYAVKHAPCPIGAFDTWCGHLLNVDGLIDNALKETIGRSGNQLCMHSEVLQDGTELVIEIESVAQGLYANDYLRNKFIADSDHKKVYRFDAETKLLKGFEVFVHTEKEDVLVFEVNEIEYNPQLDDGLFTLELPKDVVWFEEPKILPDNEKYEKMTPKEAAETFFKACADKNWDEVLKFWSMSRIDERLKEYLGGLQIISIGEPFKSGRYGGWFIPYEIKLSSGDVKKHNLAVRNDNPAKRWVVDGGI